jgi:hypothetical protein
MRAFIAGFLLLAAAPLLADDPRPATTSNNDSCDIAVLPAATLLLPYFEVETAGPQGAATATVFTITNTSRYPQIAHVTLWTDYAFPVLNFDLFLTGYDVQGINLYDVIVRGLVVPGSSPGTGITTVPGSSQPAGVTAGATPLSNTSNPNFVASAPLDVNRTCAGLPGNIDRDLIAAVRSALTVGTGASCGSSRVGSFSGTLAKGYITVDVVSYCSSKFPTDPDGSYFSGPDAPLLFDNVLLGDYQQIGPTPNDFRGGTSFDAQGSPMVHIRAVPEGGLSGASLGLPADTNLPFTFYDRYTPKLTRTADRRQPLPSLWTSRYLQGGVPGFVTNLKIWREGITSGLPACSGSNAAEINGRTELASIILFDEHENSYAFAITNCVGGCILPTPSLPATSRTAPTSGPFPQLGGTDVGGWLYLNLNSRSRQSGVEGSGIAPPVCRPVLSAQRSGFGGCNDAALGTSGSRATSQNWVVTSMFGAIGRNRLSVDSDAAALGNGCSPARPPGAVVAPVPSVAAGFSPSSELQPSSTDNSDSCDIAVLPAATLLLPYFDVDTAAAQGASTTTLFTITNTSPYPQIAHVTVWTDWGFPVLNFNIFLTGYDVQAINLFDIIVRAIIAPGTGEVPGTSIRTLPGSPQPVGRAAGPTPLSNTSNPNFVLSGPANVMDTCARLSGSIDLSLFQAVKNALTIGTGFNAGGVNCGPSRIGFNHGTHAKGYLTVDVVSYCTSKFPTDPDGSYFSGPDAPLLFDNVLLGDYQQIAPSPVGSGVTTFDAQGSPMVHIRAVPEGGLSGASLGLPIATNLPFTFYDRYTPSPFRAADRRQPLPSLWTARSIQGGAGAFATNLTIWREGITAGLPACSGANAAELNSRMDIASIVRFDEHENSFAINVRDCVSNCFLPAPSLPAASNTASTELPFPGLTGTDLGGWLYLNLNSQSRQAAADFFSAPPLPCRPVLSAQRGGFETCGDALPGTSGSRATSQNWVVTSMFGAVGPNRLAVNFDAAALGNGCSPAAPPRAVIGPLSQRNGLVCPPNAPPATCGPALRPPTPNP